MKKSLKFWIKERNNPHLTRYYVAMGQMTKKAALKHEDTLYGENIMLEFDTVELYWHRISHLRTLGYTVH